MQLQVSLPRQLAITVVIMLALIAFVYLFGIPNPNIVLIVGLVLCSALFGYGGGIVAALIMLLYTLFFYSTDHSFIQFSPENMQKVWASLVGICLDMLLVCGVKQSELEAFEEVDSLTKELHRENEQLQSMSFTDGLTKVRNRTALRNDYDSYLGHEVVVMMLDLDDFKSINDTKGHEEGDRILKETAQLLASTFGTAHCYRYGGDEFLVILPDEPESELHKMLDAMMQARPQVTAGDAATAVGFSVGYVRARLNTPDDFRDLIVCADERMYQQKRDKSRRERGAYSQPMEPAAQKEPTKYTVRELEAYLKKLSETYDFARVVDPIECRVLEIQEDGKLKMSESCYGIWGGGQKCLNCSSALACRTGRQQEKSERFDDKVYSIQSNPVTLQLPDGAAYDAVVELGSVTTDGATLNVNDRAAENVGTRAIHYRANHDGLTGVLNAEAFYEEARELIGRNPDVPWVMVTADIMRFRLVNTLFGVIRGNEVLVRTASLLEQVSDATDGLCGRLGGDRFALLVPSDGYDEQSLRDAAKALALGFEDGAYALCVHFGVYHIEDASLPVSVMCGRANSALHTIRESLTEIVAYFDDSIRQRILLEQTIISEFDGALRSGQFQMYLQPLVESSGRVIGAEALARWCKPDGTIVMPSDFIETLERAGLIQKLDAHIWELAVRQLSIWKGTERGDLTISVNMSARDFYSIDVYGVLTNLMEKYGVDCHMLRLEITETALLVEPDKGDKVIRMLHEKGFLVEIDDFGKGYSSLSLLKNIRADVLKIDMGFLREIKDHHRSKIILQAVIDMANSLGMDVITEGVETKQQLDVLASMGCNLFQGYYFSRPIPINEFVERFADVRHVD